MITRVTEKLRFLPETTCRPLFLSGKRLSVCSSMKCWSVRIQVKRLNCFGVDNYVNYVAIVLTLVLALSFSTHLYDIIKAHKSKIFR